jgi:hypothetical protein
MSAALETEMDTFRRELPGLLAHPANRGRFVLIRGELVAGLFSTFEAGLEAGYNRFGLGPFLVKEVTDREKPLYFSRPLRCHT